MKLVIQNLRQATQTGRKKLSRRLLHFRMRGQPQADILREERKLRGVEQYDKLRKADIAFVSFGRKAHEYTFALSDTSAEPSHQDCFPSLPAHPGTQPGALSFVHSFRIEPPSPKYEQKTCRLDARNM